MSLRSFLSRIVPSLAAGAAADAGRQLTLDYEQLIHLDAESLAEQGIGTAYRALIPRLVKYATRPVEVEESVDVDATSYSVKAGSFEFVIYSPNSEGGEAQSWGRACYAFFSCVNRQLDGTAVRFYAINSANDLGGMFLTPEQAELARASLPRRLDWPYLPDPLGPWYGQFH